MDGNFGHMTLGEAFTAGFAIGVAVMAFVAAIVASILQHAHRPDEHVLQTWDRGDHTLALMRIDEAP